jgi:hypothetical protein
MKQFTLLFFTLLAIQCSLQAQDMITYGDTIRFENDNAFISIDTSQNNIWQIGVPQKNIFNAAYSPNRAILTDTLQPYPINNNSYFQVMVTNQNLPFFLFPMSVFLEFKHKINSDSLKDGGYITISYDKGITWDNVINSAPPFVGFFMNTNIYSQSDTLIDGKVGFSGTDTSWKTTNIGWPLMGVKNNVVYDTILFRFNFISDSIQTNKDGWMIDDIRLYAVFYSGINEKQTMSLAAFPNPCNNDITFSFPLSNDTKQLSIFASDGTLVYQSKLTSKQYFRYDSSVLPDGIYVARLLAGNGSTQLEKFVVKH